MQPKLINAQEWIYAKKKRAERLRSIFNKGIKWIIMQTLVLMGKTRSVKPQQS